MAYRSVLQPNVIKIGKRL